MNAFKIVKDDIKIISVDSRLPYVNDTVIYNYSEFTRVEFFYNSYYNLLIVLSIIDELLKIYNKEEVNIKLKSMMDYYLTGNLSIKDVDMFRELILVSLDTYCNECNNYINNIRCGSLLHLGIVNIEPLRFIRNVKNIFEIEECFNIVINIDKMSNLSKNYFNKFIKYRYMGDLSIKYNLNNNKTLTKIKK